ncbi:MAG: prepilin peptidase [Chloroflexi bacterium]|nr:prepilin peptidase [Chloroflexota bacterium]
MVGLLIGLLGWAAGGLLNFLAERLPTRHSLRRAPACLYCDAPRPPWQWLTLLAYLGGRGRCRRCGAHPPLRYAAVEAACVVLFVLLWWRHGLSWPLAYQAVFNWLLLLLVVTDLEHRLIPNAAVLPGLALAALVSFFRLERSAGWFWMGAVFAFVFIYSIYLLGGLFAHLVNRRRGGALQEVVFGAGDVKLAVFIGLAVGFPEVVFALLIGIFLGGLAALGYLVYQLAVTRRYTPFAAMPYGPFLALGAWAMLWFGPQILRWYIGS